MGWTGFVDLIYGVLACVSTALGGSVGWAIAVVSLVVRVVLLPLTLRVAYRGLETRAALRRIEPELKRIREKHKKDKSKVLEETALLYRRHGVRLADGRTLFGTMAQVLVGLGQAVVVRRRARQLLSA